jgi:hypothetical protein
VVSDNGAQHEQDGYKQACPDQFVTTEVKGPTSGQPSVRDNDVHNLTFSNNPGTLPKRPYRMRNAPRLHSMLSLAQAVGEAPSLAALQERIRASQHCLQIVRPLIPSTLRQHIKAGPMQDTEWCILVNSAAASTKLRQLLPAMQQVLTQNGVQVSAIRIKVQMA